MKRINLNQIFFIIAIFLAAAHLLTITLFALDSKTIIGLLISFIPTALLIGLLILARFKTKIAGISYIALGIIFTLFSHTYNNLLGFIIISLPLFLVGIFFILSKTLNHKR